MNFLNQIAESNYGENLVGKFSIGEIVAFGGKIVLIGMLTIFAVLTLIWACLALFKVFFHDLKSGAPKKEAVVANPVIEAPAPIVYSSDDEIVAVIAAAIAAAESESCGAKFRVVSFRRK